jgi:hypothetical protein
VNPHRAAGAPLQGRWVAELQHTEPTGANDNPGYAKLPDIPTNEFINLTGPGNVSVNSHFWTYNYSNAATTSSYIGTTIQLWKGLTLIQSTGTGFIYFNKVGPLGDNRFTNYTADVDLNFNLPDADGYTVKFINDKNVVYIAGDSGQNYSNFRATVNSTPLAYDSTTYTVVSATATTEGMLLTLNTATAFSSYNKIWQDATQTISTYSSELTVLQPYSPITTLDYIRNDFYTFNKSILNNGTETQITAPHLYASTITNYTP